MFTPQTAIWSIAGGITQTLFDAGTLLHKKRSAVAAFDQAAAQYRSTVIKAFQNVADALRALQADAAALRAQAEAEQTAAASLDLAREQFRLGAINYLTLANAERTYEQAHINLVQAQASRYSPTPPHCSRRWAAAGGIAPTWRPMPSASPTASGSRSRPNRTDGEVTMIKRMIIMLLAVGVVLGACFGFQVFKAHIIKQVMASLANPPQTVSTITAGYQEWQPQVSAVGTLRAVNGADLSLQLAGIVSEIDFKSGDDVQAGQVLLRLRNDDDVAKLHALQATAELAQINYDRDRKQFLVAGRRQATVDSDAASLKNDQAQVAQQQAMVDQKMLRAPFAGHLGIRAVDLGQYLRPAHRS